MPHATPRSHVLPFGAFYGRPAVRRVAPGLEMAVLDADPHRVVERHGHEEAHFVFVLAGLYVSSAAGAPAVSAGPLLVYNPAGTTHRDRFEAQAARGGGRRFDGRFLTLSVGADLVAAAVAEGGAPDVATVVRDPSALALARRLAGAVAGDGTNAAVGEATGDTAAGATLLDESLALALLAAAAPARDPGAVRPPRWLATARELLDDRCDDSVRVSELARAAGVHPVHLARVFRRYLGCTPGDYLRRRRLERAAALLRATTRPLTDVALHCGFVDQSHFAHAFKRGTGMTPGAYRRLPGSASSA